MRIKKIEGTFKIKCRFLNWFLRNKKAFYREVESRKNRELSFWMGKKEVFHLKSASENSEGFLDFSFGFFQDMINTGYEFDQKFVTLLLRYLDFVRKKNFSKKSKLKDKIIIDGKVFQAELSYLRKEVVELEEVFCSADVFRVEARDIQRKKLALKAFLYVKTDFPNKGIFAKTWIHFIAKKLPPFTFILEP